MLSCSHRAGSTDRVSPEQSMSPRCALVCTWLLLGPTQTTALPHPPPPRTFRVSSMDRNFLWSPISMALLMMGSSIFTASSMGKGGMFSPPAVMINSGKEKPRPWHGL